MAAASRILQRLRKGLHCRCGKFTRTPRGQVGISPGDLPTVGKSPPAMGSMTMHGLRFRARNCADAQRSRATGSAGWHAGEPGRYRGAFEQSMGCACSIILTLTDTIKTFACPAH
jgi:hypothetical protein